MPWPHNRTSGTRRRWRDEVTLFSHVVAHNSEARDAHVNLGSALFEAERYDEGLTATRIAAEQRPDSAGALANLGRALIHFGRLQEAEEHLRRAVRLDPRSTTAHQNLAEALRKQERFAEAVESYQAVLAIDEDYALAYAGMGTALSLHPDLPVAGSSLRVFLSRAAQASGRPDAADHFARAVRDDPRDYETLDHLAMARFAQQRYQDALALYRSMIELDPENATTRSTLGATLFHLGQMEEALMSIERALAFDPDLQAARIGLQAVRDAQARRQR